MPHNVRLIAHSASVGNVCSLQAICCTAAPQHELFAWVAVEHLSKSIFTTPLTGFNEQHFPLRHFGETRRNHRARRATANDNEIVFVIWLRTKLYVWNENKIRLEARTSSFELATLTRELARPQGSSRSHWERMKTSSRPINSMNALPPHVEASVGPVGTPTKQSQADVLVDIVACCWLWIKTKQKQMT